MRTVTYGAACSLDGFITDARGALDWLHFSADVQRITGEYWATIDTMLMGRKTYEAAVAQTGGGDPPASSSTKTGKPAANPYAGMATYIFSRTMTEAPEGTTLVREDAGGFVRALKERPGRGICVMGGGELGRSLLEAGVVDEVGLNIHPILLGDGTPLFRDAGRRIALELIESRTIDGGCVVATYRVRR